MKAYRRSQVPGSPISSHSRASRVLLSAAIVAVSASAIAACSSSAAPPTSTSATPAAAKQYLQESGTGDKLLSAVTLPQAWTVSWTFNCQDASTSGTFSLTTTKNDGKPVSVTNQTGLGGGGHKPFTVAGKYGFAVTTTCGWKATVSSTPKTPVKASVPATTTPSAKPKSATTSSAPAKSKSGGSVAAAKP